MSYPPLPTPNRVVQNPVVRKVAGNTLAAATLVLLVVILVDVNVPAIDLSEWTVPAAGILSGLFSIFQLGVTSPNVPTRQVNQTDQADQADQTNTEG